jgi:hypothetical protein
MNFTYIANEIKNRLDTIQVFEYYGLQPNIKGFICCPFHNEKTPSFKVYKGNGGYHCFGCGEHGGVIDFVMKYFDLSFKEAITKLNNDFCLGLLIGEKFDRRKQIDLARKSFNARREREKQQNEYNRLKNAREIALDEWTILDIQKMKYKPKTQNEELHPLFLDAIINLPHAEYRLECAETELYLYETRNRCNT